MVALVIYIVTVGVNRELSGSVITLNPRSRPPPARVVAVVERVAVVVVDVALDRRIETK